MFEINDRVQHNAQGSGTVRASYPPTNIHNNMLDVQFDTGINGIVDSCNCKKIGVIPESIDIGDHFVWNNHITVADDICVAGTTIIVFTGDTVVKIPRFKSTVQITLKG